MNHDEMTWAAYLKRPLTWLGCFSRMEAKFPTDLG